MKFVYFEIAKKLKEKGYPQVKKNTIAMYSEYGEWYSLAQNLDDFEYSFADFDEHDYVCPTISQALDWLREKYSIHVSTKPYPCEDGVMWLYEIRKFSRYISIVEANKAGFIREEQASLAGIEYILDNLIVTQEMICCYDR